jgi:hypothetical protein
MKMRGSTVKPRSTTGSRKFMASSWISSILYPPGAIDRFSLRSQRVDGNIAFITWSVGSGIPLGTDTFVVNNGKIVSQTFAMYAVPAQ